MKNLTVGHYMVIGLVFWGVPGALVAGPMAVVITLVAAMPVWLLARRPAMAPNGKVLSTESAWLLLLLALVYLLLDAGVGRQKFATNLFLSASATRDVIDSANEAVSQGRGVVDLFGALMVFAPFALIDTARRAPIALRSAMWLVGLLFLFYDVGISRGYLLMAVLAVAIGTATNLRNLLWAGLLSLIGFVAASAARGDFSEVSFSNPLFDAVVYPYINLTLMLDSDCGQGGWLDFLMEFTKKFLPAFIFPKEVFSFNIEMTRCIYPMFGDSVDSISIFTWLGEMFYYQPSILTALGAGCLLALLSRHVDLRMTQMNLWSTRVFVGMLCIVLLRSRVQDVFSFLVFLWLFLIIWRIVVHIKPSLRVNQAPKTESASR